MQNWTNTQFGIGIVLSYGLAGVVLLILPSQQGLVGIILLIIAGVIAVITSFIYWDERKGYTVSKKIYLDYLNHMFKDYIKFRKKIRPAESIKFRFWWRRFFTYKPLPEQELMNIKWRYEKWRESLYKATEFVFAPPTDTHTFPIQIIFENHGIPGVPIEWRSQLLSDFVIIDFLMKFNSLSFSKKYEDAPEKLNELKDYLK